MTERFAEDPSRISAEGELVLAYLGGDQDAFGVLYARYYPDVLRRVRAAVRDEALAQDIAQEAMAGALKSLGGFHVAEPFWPWLRKIADNAANAALAARKTEVLVEHVAHDALVGPDDADLFVTREMIAACLAALPDRQRRALSLRYLEGWRTDDIAALFGVTRNAVEQLLDRARRRFRIEFRRRDTGVVPVFGGLLARLRKLLSAADARVQGLLSSPYSAAGDLALGVAVTFGVGLAIAGSAGRVTVEVLPPRLEQEQEQGPRTGGDVDRQDDFRYVSGRAAGTAVDTAASAGRVAPPWPDQLGPRRRAVRAGAPRPVPTSDGGPVASDPHTPGGSGAEPGPGRPGPLPSPEPAPEPAPAPSPAPGGEPAPEPPGITEPPWISGPTEEPSVAPALIDGVEPVPSASSEVTVEDDEVEEGKFRENHRVETELLGEPVGVGGGVSRSGDDSYSCDKLGVCLPVP